MTNEVAKHIIKSLDYYLQNRFEDYGERNHEAMLLAIKALEQEPKTGHWIEVIDHEENCRTLICSNCDRPALHDEDSIWKHKFCPHCGAKMESEVRDADSN